MKYIVFFLRLIYSFGKKTYCCYHKVRIILEFVVRKGILFHDCFIFLYDFRIGIQKLKTVKMKVLMNTLLFICMLSMTQSLVNSNESNKSRQIRSPQKRGNLKLCNSAFTNFPLFKARGCPPPRFCTLSKPLKERYCVKANVPASKRNSFYFPKN